MATGHRALKASVMTGTVRHEPKGTGLKETGHNVLKVINPKDSAPMAINRREITQTGAINTAAQIRITKTAPAEIRADQQNNNNETGF
jgi:hypothetical protein